MKAERAIIALQELSREAEINGIFEMTLDEINAEIEQVRTWDPDFCKVTPAEDAVIKQAESEMENGEYYTDEDVWN